MTRYRLLDGKKVAYTAKEEAARDAEEAAVAKEQAANEYKKKRREAFTAIQEQLDMLYHDLVAGKLDATGTWAKHIKAVKDANPKQ